MNIPDTAFAGMSKYEHTIKKWLRQITVLIKYKSYSTLLNKVMSRNNIKLIKLIRNLDNC